MQLKWIAILSITLVVLLVAGFYYIKNSDECPVDEVKWVEINEDLESGANLEFQIELNAALEKDLQDLRTKGDEKVNYRVDSVLKKYSKRKAEVSKEFYQAYLAKRAEICALHFSLVKDNFKDLSSRKDAEKQYLDALKDLGKMGGAPEKSVSQKADELRQHYANAKPGFEKKIAQMSGQKAIEGVGYLGIYQDQLEYLETDIKRFGANELSAEEFEINLGLLEKKLVEYANLIQNL